MITEQVTAYHPVTAALATLRATYQGKVFDCSIAEQEREARSARHELSRLNGALDAAHKSAKELALKECQRLDAQKRDIAAEISALRDPIDAQIRAEEARVAKAEAIRVAEIKTRIDQVCMVGLGTPATSANELRGWIATLESLTFDPSSYSEFAGEASLVRDRELERMNTLLVNRVAADVELARIAEEKVRIAAERAEQAKRDAEESARIAAERAALAAERAEAERIDRERREALAAEERVAAAVRAEADRVAREKRDAEEAVLAAERKKLADEQAEAARVRAAEEAARAAENLRIRNAAHSMFSALKMVLADSGFQGLSDATRNAVTGAIQ